MKVKTRLVECFQEASKTPEKGRNLEVKPYRDAEVLVIAVTVPRKHLLRDARYLDSNEWKRYNQALAKANNTIKKAMATLLPEISKIVHGDKDVFARFRG